MKTIHLISLSLLLITASAADAAQNYKTPLLPSKAISKTEKNNRIIEYCPDNPCEIISTPRSTDKQVFEDFAVLFFSYASGYIYLEKSYDNTIPYRKQTKDKVKEIIARQRNECKGEELAVVSCIMQRLARDYKIRASFSRFDEGKDVITPYDPQDEFSLKSLQKTKAWYKTQ